MGLIVNGFQMQRYGFVCDAYISIADNTLVLQKIPQTGSFTFCFTYYLWHSKDSRVSNCKHMMEGNVVFDIPQAELVANAYSLAYANLKQRFLNAVDDI